MSDTTTTPDITIQPFRVEVPDTDLEDLQDRLRRTRWPDQIPGSDWTYGADLTTVRTLAERWADGYDWRAYEAEVNAFDQGIATIDGQRIHFLHARSPEPDAIPLIMTHGWPGSIAEFRQVIGPLVDPVAHGGDAADAFHLVVPSLPGYGFSGPTTEPGWDVRRVAQAFATLMAALGYDRYGAQGGDWGSMVSRQLGTVDPEHLIGIHVNMIIGFGPGGDDDRADLSAVEASQLARFDDYMTTGNGYVSIQSTRPQTLAYGLVDSPVGLLGWITEKLWAWTDNDGDVLAAVPPDEQLTNVAIYWFTGTAGSSARLYYESMRTGAMLPPAFRDVPLGVAAFPKEIVGCRRRWVEQDYDIRRWTEMPRGGHFAALEEPDLLVDEVREFFRPCGEVDDVVSDLHIRKIPWQFDETTPFQWNPANPEFGLIGNVVSFVAPAFERYIVAVVRRAQERITDPAAAEEADLFLRQEALHARAHRNHTAALVAQFPGLQEPLDAADAMYDDLLEREPLEYHLAYVADIEATFTPFFRMMLDNEASLFAGGDDRVASLLVWHFVEEIEHRSSALIVYRAVVDGDWYRARKMPSVFKHVRGVADVIFDAFERHVPKEVRLVDPPRRSTLKRLPAELLAGRKGERAHPSAYADVPKGQLLRMGYGLVRSQLPGHQPRDQRLPAFADAWFDAYDRQVDVTRWYESTAATAGVSA